MKYASDYEPFQNDYTQYISDKYFAEQRLAGVNPLSIKKITFSNSGNIILQVPVVVFACLYVCFQPYR